MENKLFENAKFGDRFVTRDGRNALYLSKDEYAMLFAVEGCNCVIACYHDGTMMYPCDSDYDIISRYVEPIDEEELDEIAKEYEKNYPMDDPCYSYYCYDGFKAGYRKAKEG